MLARQRRAAAAATVAAAAAANGGQRFCPCTALPGGGAVRPPPPPSIPGCLCSNECVGNPDYANDGMCDDGGAGFEYTSCELGTDCADCGWEERCAWPPSPPPPASPPAVCAGAARTCWERAVVGAHCLPLSGSGGAPQPTGGVERLLNASASALSAALGVNVTRVSRPCGDGHCAAHERLPTPWVRGRPLPEGACYADCGCGDGVCDSDSSLGRLAPSEGELRSFPAETPSSCPVDCACGDGVCQEAAEVGEYAEDYASCPEDCSCGNGVCDNECSPPMLQWSPWLEVRSNCNETAASCGMDCHCGDGVCQPHEWAETRETCMADCFCGDGVCNAADGENWLSCQQDCAGAICGNNVCECTASGEWGGDYCCFGGGIDGSISPSYCSVTAAGGPETPESCPHDCGAPCPPFCDVEVCADGLPYYAAEVDGYELQYRAVGAAVTEDDPFATVIAWGDSGGGYSYQSDAGMSGMGGAGSYGYSYQGDDGSMQYYVDPTMPVGPNLPGLTGSTPSADADGSGGGPSGGGGGGASAGAHAAFAFSALFGLPHVEYDTEEAALGLGHLPVAAAPSNASEIPWISFASGAASRATLNDLSPSTRYEVRVRGGNAAGWGNWSETVTLQTTGLPVGGACLQDDAPCGQDGSGKFTDVTFTYNGLGCQFAPVVSVVGGNCLDNVTGSAAATSPSDVASGEVGSGEVGSGSGEAGSGGSDGSVSSTCDANCSSCGERAIVEAVVVDGIVVRLVVVYGGSEYNEAPTLAFSSGNCSLHPQAYTTISNGAVTSADIYAGCLSPGGNMMERMYSSSGVRASTWRDNRSAAMNYDNDMECGWRIRPPLVPSGHKLRLSLDFVNTERGYDFVHLLDGAGGAAFGDARTWDFHAPNQVPYHLQGAGISTLVHASGRHSNPAARLSDQDSALVIFSSDSGVVKPGGFVLRYAIQALQV